jgi:fused signal recognition particle receptor
MAKQKNVASFPGWASVKKSKKQNRKSKNNRRLKSIRRLKRLSKPPRCRSGRTTHSKEETEAFAEEIVEVTEQVQESEREPVAVEEAPKPFRLTLSAKKLLKKRLRRLLSMKSCRCRKR